MVFLSHTLVLSTLLLCALSSPTPQDQQRRQQQERQQPHPSHSPGDPDHFQRLLADVDESSIHSALHLWSSKFQDGVFSHDRTALEAVHSEDAPLATSLLRMAKRQSNDTSAVPSSNPPPGSTTVDPVSQPPVPSSSTPTFSSPEGAIPPTSSRTTATRAPTTEAVAISTPASATPIATSDGRVVFSVSTNRDNSQGGLTTVDATSAVVSFTPISSIVLSTFTLPDGVVSVQTSITVVDAPVTGGNLGAPAATGTGGVNSPSLQEGVASATRGVWKEVVAVLGGALVLGLAL